MEIFLAAVRTGTYTAAARQLEINRTTVGRRVEALERTLGVALFEQTPLGYAPTAAGARLLATAEAIEREVAMMVTDLGTIGRRSAPIRIASSAGLATEFLPEIATFRRANPDLPVELLGELDPLDAVTQRRAHLGIALVRSPPLRLSGVEVGVLSQATYALRGAGDLPRLGWGYEFDAALPGGAWTGANPSGEVAQAAGLATCNDWPQLKQAVLSGLGSASLWCFAADGEPSLVRTSPPNSRHDSPLWLVHHAKSPVSPGLARLIDFLREAIAAQIGDRPTPSSTN